jgi:hypothetical protein
MSVQFETHLCSLLNTRVSNIELARALPTGIKYVTPIPDQGETYKRFYPGAQEETGRKGRKSRKNSGQRIAGLSAARKPISARQFAACPEFRVGRSKLRRCSGTPRPDGHLVGIRTAYV